LKNLTELVDGVGGYTVALLNAIISGFAETGLLKLIGRDIFLFHGLKQWFVTDHDPPRFLG